jgi:Bax protein
MQSRTAIITCITIAILGLALAAGIGAGRIYEDLAPTQKQSSLKEQPPLPGWVAEPLPDFSSYTDVQTRKKAFFDYLFPRVALANRRVLALRDQVEALSAKASLTAEEEAFLAQQAERLRVEAPIGSPESFELLSRRLDIIPPSLVLAQAANESAWGTSRFARQGNNLFGQWCFSPGCGLVPLQRTDGASHEVASFDSPYLSVRSYITNLNRHPRYQGLRVDRARLRAENRMPTGVALAPGLGAYSERGGAYIEEIVDMMQFNKLQRYDRLFDSWLKTGVEADKPYILLRNRQASLALD